MRAHPSQNVGVEVSGEYDRIPVLISAGEIDFCTLKVEAHLNLDYDPAGSYAVNRAHYKILADEAPIETFQVGHNSWLAIEKDLREKAAELYAKGEGTKEDEE